MDFTGRAGQDGIVIDTDMAVFEDNLTMEGTPPDIRYIKSGDAGQQVDIFSGTYGNINGENEEAFLIRITDLSRGKSAAGAILMRHRKSGTMMLYL